MDRPSVSVTVVTFNGRQWIKACLDSVLAQKHAATEIVVVDNASTDGTLSLLAQFGDRVRVVRNRRNIGFSAAQNQAIRATTGDWVLTLNPDVLLEPGFLVALLDAGMADARVGSVCGKLLRIRRDFSRFELSKIDSAGIFFTPPLRHFDRGWNEVDHGQYDRVEYVFGASAAAALYRREMIEQLSMDEEFFDNDFFAYREDADVAWRGQLTGWRCVYTPDAVGWHVRRVTPANRSEVPAILNMHSVKNRFLMRIKNMTGPLYRRVWWQAFARDLVVMAGCLVFEHSSLRALPLLCRGLRRARAWRRFIMSRRTADDAYMAAWFQTEPATQPFPSAPLGYRTPSQSHSGEKSLATGA